MRPDYYSVGDLKQTPWSMELIKHSGLLLLISQPHQCIFLVVSCLAWL